MTPSSGKVRALNPPGCRVDLTIIVRHGRSIAQKARFENDGVRLPDDPTNSRFRNPGVTRLIPRWCGFWLSGPLLLVSVLLEGVHATIAAIHFLLTRKRQRERFKAMLQGRLAGILVLAASVLLLEVGCASFPGSSFEDQIDQLSWSAEALTSGDGEIKDALLDFHFMLIGDLSLEPLRDSFEQLGW